MKTYTTGKFRTDYGRQVRFLRTVYMDDTLTEFAKKLGISAGYLNKIELGKVVPGPDLKLKLEYYMDLYRVDF